MESVILICVVFGLAASAFVISIVRYFEKKRVEKAAPSVEARFRSLCLSAENARLEFRGEVAIPIHDFALAAGEWERGMVFLNRICRNPYGEYFHVVISEQGCYIKHLPEERALLALKGITRPDLASFPIAAQKNSPLVGAEEIAGEMSPPFTVLVSKTGNGEAQGLQPAVGDTPKGDLTFWRRIGRLSVGTRWFPSLVAFVATMFILMLKAGYRGDYEPIGPLRVALGIISGLLVFLPFVVLLKWWMRDRWNSSDWPAQVIAFLVHSVWGIAIAAAIWDVLIYIFLWGYAR